MATLRTNKINSHLLKEEWQFQVGGHGEEIVVRSMMESLPDEYQLFYQVEIPNKRSRTGNTEIDVLLVGPTGIICIEVKTVNGHVQIDRGSANWNVFSHVSDETWKIRNPAKQGYSQKNALSTWLKQQGFNSPVIEHIVIFPTEGTTVEVLEDPWCKIFLGCRPAASHCQRKKLCYDNITVAQITKKLIRLQGVNDVISTEGQNNLINNKRLNTLYSGSFFVLILLSLYFLYIESNNFFYCLMMFPVHSLIGSIYNNKSRTKK